MYNEGIKLIEAGQPAEARLKLQEVLKSPADMGLLDNAEYWIGVSYFDEGRYDDAAKHYRKAQLLPDGNKAAPAQYELALATALYGDTAYALMEFYRVLTLYPTSGLDEKVEKQIQSLGGPSKANIPTHGPVTPSLAKASTSDESIAGGSVVPTSGPLAGAEVPVAPKRETEPTASEPEKAEKPPATGETGAEKTPETKPPTEAKPTPTPADESDEQKESVPVGDDPRNLIRPEEKEGF